MGHTKEEFEKALEIYVDAENLAYDIAREIHKDTLVSDSCYLLVNDVSVNEDGFHFQFELEEYCCGSSCKESASRILIGHAELQDPEGTREKELRKVQEAKDALVQSMRAREQQEINKMYVDEVYKMSNLGIDLNEEQNAALWTSVRKKYYGTTKYALLYPEEE